MQRQTRQNKYQSKWQTVKGTSWSFLLSLSGGMLALPSATYLAISASELLPIGLSRGWDQVVANTSGLIFGSICLVFGLGMMIRGTAIRKRLKRFKRYEMLIDNQTSYALDDLAAITSRSVGYITKDLQKMIGDNLFPDAYIDRHNGTIIIGRQNYTPVIKGQVQQRIKTTGNLDIDQMISEGNDYLKQIRRTGATFGDKKLLTQLRRLEEVCEKIFAYVAENPAKLPEIRKFMNYYLPTTLKLLKSYERFRKQDIKGQNLTAAMSHIEQMLTTIITAFEKLLDNLFQDETFDVSADITVLENMLAQEGLTSNSLELNIISPTERTAKHD